MKTTLVTINGKTYRKAILTGDQFLDCIVSACTLCMFNNRNGCNTTSEYDCTNGWFIEEVKEEMSEREKEIKSISKVFKKTLER